MTATRPHRTLAAAPSLRSLTHPTRLALMEQVSLAGTLTATQASALVGESPSACAYHLRTLAKLGFLEEAGGRGRERPWRLASASLAVSGDSENLPVAGSADTLTTMLTERYIAQIRAFELARSSVNAEVQAVTGLTHSTVFATVPELRQLRAQILALLSRYASRIDPARRPPGAVPFELIMFTHPVQVAGAQRVAGAGPSAAAGAQEQ